MITQVMAARENKVIYKCDWSGYTGYESTSQTRLPIFAWWHGGNYLDCRETTFPHGRIAIRDQICIAVRTFPVMKLTGYTPKHFVTCFSRFSRMRGLLYTSFHPVKNSASVCLYRVVSVLSILIRRGTAGRKYTHVKCTPKGRFQASINFRQVLEWPWDP